MPGVHIVYRSRYIRIIEVRAMPPVAKVQHLGSTRRLSEWKKQQLTRLNQATAE